MDQKSALILHKTYPARAHGISRQGGRHIATAFLIGCGFCVLGKLGIRRVCCLCCSRKATHVYHDLNHWEHASRGARKVHRVDSSGPLGNTSPKEDVAPQFCGKQHAGTNQRLRLLNFLSQHTQKGAINEAHLVLSHAANTNPCGARQQKPAHSAKTVLTTSVCHICRRRPRGLAKTLPLTIETCVVALSRKLSGCCWTLASGSQPRSGDPQSLSFPVLFWGEASSPPKSPEKSALLPELVRPRLLTRPVVGVHGRLRAPQRGLLRRADQRIILPSIT